MKKGTKGIQNAVIASALRIARATHATILFVSIDPLKEPPTEGLPKGCRFLYITRRTEEEIASQFPEGLHVPLIHLPKVEMTRMGQVKMAAVLALSNKLMTPGERVVFVSGNPGQDLLDSIVFIDTTQETEIMMSQGGGEISEGVQPEVFEEALSIALELASRGREGKSVGTIFVLGDEERVLQLSKQMIINPFKGYTEEERNILNPDLRETLREFAALDGAFVISADGYVLSAGTHLGAAAEEDTIPRGLGARHIAASGITSLTKAIAIVISESTGDLRIFKNGKILMEIEKPMKVPT